MSNNFNLCRKDNVKAGAVNLNDIDIELCNHFNEQVDPNQFLGGWVNVVGFRVAIGNTLSEVRDMLARHCNECDEWNDEEGADYYEAMVELTDYLNRHYVADSWATVGR